ncbi:MAG: hypothetical protein Q8Q52_08165 [Acidimicrobiia bacterium]|nr:hypothetical protein [Acidimicrobiia bacterium]
MNRRPNSMTTTLRSLLALTLLIAACGGASADDPGDSNATAPSTAAPSGTIPDDAGPVFVDSTDILVAESAPAQVTLAVTGNLPTPCHEAVWEVDDDGATITVTLASISDPAVICTQVLKPFEISIPLGSFASGSRLVILNGEDIGSFDI